MNKIFSTLILSTISVFLIAQPPAEYDISGSYLETDDLGNFYAAIKDEIFVFDLDGNVLDTITTDFDETFGTIVDFRIGRDGKMYVLYDFSNGVYEVDDSGALTKVLDGSYGHFEVNENGGILASIENGKDNILRYVDANLDTTIILNDSINASNLVFDIEIDDEDTFWVAYQKGVLSFKNFELKRHNENAIKDIFVGKDNKVYVVYNFETVGYMNEGEDEITRIDFNDAIGTKICGDSNGNIYVSYEDVIYQFKDGVWISYEVSGSARAQDFEIDSKNNVVMAKGGNKYIWKQEPSTTIDKEIKNITIYPNPVSDVININRDWKKATNLTYEIISINGLSVRSGILQKDQINISNLPNGIYYLSFDELVESIKFIKQ